MPSPPPIRYHVALVELAYIALRVIEMNAPARINIQSLQTIDGLLANWLLKVEMDSAGMDEYSKTLLRLHYQLVILHLHRNHAEESNDSQVTCKTAAQTIVSCLETIANLDLLMRCHFTVVSAATAAGIQIVHEARAAILSENMLAALGLLEQLDRLVRCTRALAEYWPSSEGVGNVFDGLKKDYQQIIAQSLDHAEGLVPDLQPDWDSLFASIPMPELQPLSNEQDWMNLTSWTDLA
ncbi:Hypothetical protein D9617_28g064840 [Elsinoe fawcettii]|nr:Hypothetical protein D9617_28g064840 [Elsinoe fawcettii]